MSGPAVPKVQDALGYLESVKSAYANDPSVYNRFLDIMNLFKHERISTVKVIQEVKQLFWENPYLIEGFNQFLPDGCKISFEAPKVQQPRFRHAVKYVSRIRERFVNRPEVYNTFLETLDDYQNRKVSINHVHHIVQQLFHEHPDLLVEFGCFLPQQPDLSFVPPSGFAGVQTAQQMQLMAQHQTGPPLGAVSRSSQPRVGPRKGPTEEAGGDRVVHHVGARGRTNVTEMQSPDGTSRLLRVSYPAGTEKIIGFFDRIKRSLSRSEWCQFLKALNLYTNDIVSRRELIHMMENILSGHYNFQESFRNLIGCTEFGTSEARDPPSNQAGRCSYYNFIESSKLLDCKKVTRSYRLLPEHVTPPQCSSQTKLCHEVLNHQVISIATGSEDFSFKNARKNVYEDNLFKCEDERFEVDLMIETNASAMKALESVGEEIANLSPEEAAKVRLRDDMDILDIRAIARLYQEHGARMVDMLHRCPALTVPVVLERLRQKDEEWRAVQEDLKPQWRKVNEANYHRSLDHRSFYFKQEEKKQRGPKFLLTQLEDVFARVYFGRSVAQRNNDESRWRGDDSVSSRVRSRRHAQRSSLDVPEDEDELPEHGSVTHGPALRLVSTGFPMVRHPCYSYCMRFDFSGEARGELHTALYRLIAHRAKSAVNDIDRCKLHLFFMGFVHPLFNVALHPDQAAAAQLATGWEAAVAKAAERTLSAKEQSSAAGDSSSESSVSVPRTTRSKAQQGSRAGSQSDEGGTLDPDKQDSAPEDAGDLPAEEGAEGGEQSMSADEQEARGVPLGGRAAALALLKASLRATQNNNRRGGRKRERGGSAEPVDQRRSRRLVAAVDGNGDDAAGGAAQMDTSSTAPSTTSAQGGASSAATGDDKLSPTALGSSVGDGVVAVEESPWTLLQQLLPVRRHLRPSHVFCGNSVYYVFFRLYQFLYERLALARHLCYLTLPPAPVSKTPPVAAAGSTGRPVLPSAVDITKPCLGAASGPSGLTHTSTASLTGAERFAHFLSLVIGLMDGTLDASDYEDRLRELLGAHAYVLFTLDKLVAQVCRQTQTLLDSKVCLRLLNLFSLFCGVRRAAGLPQPGAPLRMPTEGSAGSSSRLPPPAPHTDMSMGSGGAGGASVSSSSSSSSSSSGPDSRLQQLLLSGHLLTLYQRAVTEVIGLYEEQFQVECFTDVHTLGIGYAWAPDLVTNPAYRVRSDILLGMSDLRKVTRRAQVVQAVQEQAVQKGGGGGVDGSGGGDGAAQSSGSQDATARDAAAAAVRALGAASNYGAFVQQPPITPRLTALDHSVLTGSVRVFDNPSLTPALEDPDEEQLHRMSASPAPQSSFVCAAALHHHRIGGGPGSPIHVPALWGSQLGQTALGSCIATFTAFGHAPAQAGDTPVFAAGGVQLVNRSVSATFPQQQQQQQQQSSSQQATEQSQPPAESEAEVPAGPLRHPGGVMPRTVRAFLSLPRGCGFLEGGSCAFARRARRSFRLTVRDGMMQRAGKLAGRFLDSPQEASVRSSFLSAAADSQQEQDGASAPVLAPKHKRRVCYLPGTEDWLVRSRTACGAAQLVRAWGHRRFTSKHVATARAATLSDCASDGSAGGKATGVEAGGWDETKARSRFRNWLQSRGVAVPSNGGAAVVYKSVLGAGNKRGIRR